MSTVTVIVQARTGSTRLPGKVMRPILGKPMLERELERIRAARQAGTIVVATTTDPNDDPVAAVADYLGVGLFRGDEQDVLDRFYQVGKSVRADIIVRLTGDCPLHDPEVIDLVVSRFIEKKADYMIGPVNYPEGLDTEVFTFAALERAWREAKLPSECEHVTPYIRNHPELFTVAAAWKDGEADNSTDHWSVDTQQDFQFVEAVYAYLYQEGRMFHMQDVLQLLDEHPELREINKGATGYEGLEKSLREDEIWKQAHDK